MQKAHAPILVYPLSRTFHQPNSISPSHEYFRSHSPSMLYILQLCETPFAKYTGDSGSEKPQDSKWKRKNFFASQAFRNYETKMVEKMSINADPCNW